ncbi:MAG TPA: hypothetical protein PKM73_06895 [Verrucomicrobiota bacterium]|nr:hypothetical protein [Verrucomicrobiota bacterium]HNU49978.1 hypothetical protein [Verrucomicrobiota bacterium]
MIKRISLTGLLVGVLLLSALASVALCYRYVRTLSVAQRIQIQAQRLQAQTVLVSRNRTIAQAMASDAVEYSKRSPAMAALLLRHGPLLEQLGLKPRSTSPAQTRPNPR